MTPERRRLSQLEIHNDVPEHNKPVLPEEVDFSQGSNTRVKDAFRRTRDLIKTHKYYERSSIGNSSISNSIVPG